MATVFKRRADQSRRGAKWTITWYDAEEQQWRKSPGSTDKESSLQKGRRLETESARRAEGIDPLDDHRLASIQQHIDEYIAKIEVCRRNPTYVLQVRNRIKRIIEGVRARRIVDLEPVKVACFVDGLKFKRREVSGVTKNEYFASIKGFTSWAVTTRRAEVDPLASLKKLERRVVSTTHPRRALSPTQVASLLEASARRPLLELQTVRIGKNKGKAIAKVAPATKRRAIGLGEERRLCYLLTVWAGLRRSEVAQLVWNDIDLKSDPWMIRLRPEATKSHRADKVVIHPELAAALIRHCEGVTSADLPIVSTVPNMKAFRADLKLAGIDPGNRESGFIDFHALRKTLGTIMAASGLSPRMRQTHMRHTDPRLTENTYMDERHLPISKELGSPRPSRS